ncbi:MAG TPA: flagellar hook capping FlgD N-terminal domain-containing protein, partial [Pirellulales bacterium]|nr:flagellar hook capping FlgD N-terminal domain-containing protein [Pirellulales bacterium]
MSTSGVGSSSSSSSSSSTSTASDPFGSVNLGDFLTLMIAQLQNQDPTDPVSNSDLLQQIGDMETIESNQQLNSTLTGLSLSDSLTAGSELIGQYIVGTDSSGDMAEGQVDSVSVVNGT